jgi:hemin uptake protein HemP
MPMIDSHGNKPPPQPEAGPAPAGAATAPVESHELLGARGELLILHEGRVYRLARTRLGKLILTA